jgi:hypothetical protein
VSFVRNLLADLVAKRLWPVALVLALALVAVPVLLVRGVDEGEAPVVPVGQESEVTASVVTPATDEPRRGANPTGRNPFSQRDVSPADKTDNSGGTGGTSGDEAGATSSGSVADATGGLPALEGVDVIPVGGADGVATPKPQAKASYRVDLSFGQDGNMTARNDVARLSPLPSADDPFFVFMGVLADGETALFLISSDAVATGDGTCKPSPEDCQRVEMRAGETEFFDVTKPDGATVQYQLDLKRVSRVKSASAAVAAAARSRESSEGRQVLRSAMDTEQVDVDGIAYSRDLGVLVPSAVPGDGNGDTLFGGFRTDLRFGPPGELVNRFNLARLTPLPSIDDPAFLFLGVMGKPSDPRALFLNPSEAEASGDAVCNPTPEDCTRIELKPGESGLFDVPTIDGETDEYQLDVISITELEAASPEEARAMRDRESPAGRVILRRLINEVGGLVADLNYSSSKGRIIVVDGPAEDAGEPSPPTAYSAGK